jgi:hypothetical protein
MPSPTIIAGSSGSYTLPVANATSVTWAGSVAQPAWLTLVAANPPRLSWTAAPAAATIDATCELIAVGAGASVPSGKFGLVVSAATGFFAGYTTYKAAMNFAAQENNKGIGSQTKHTGWASHGNGRLYVFGGDFTPSGPSIPSTNYGCQIQYSLNPSVLSATVPETAWRMEHPYWPAAGYEFPVKTDCNQVAWDEQRRVFWQLSGFTFPGSLTPPNYGSPGGLGFTTRVGKFDLSKPIGQRWTSTGPLLPNTLPGGMFPDGGGENDGPAFYDATLDVIFGGRNAAPQTIEDGSIKIFDPAAAAFMGKVKFTSVPNLLPGYNVRVLALDSVNRALYLWAQYDYQENHLAPITLSRRHIYKVALPTTRADLPSYGTSADWSARATLVWSNPNPNTLLPVGGLALQDGRTRKLYCWIRGPIGTYVDGDGGQQTNGLAGHPARGNGTFGSANTGFAVDMDTGEFEYTQIPHPTYTDGQGWVLPNITLWDARNRRLVYGTCDFEELLVSPGTYLRIEPKLFVARRTHASGQPVPSWVSALAPLQWHAIAGSTCATQLPAALRTLYSGSEASGNRENELNADGQNPWFYSGGTLRQKGAVMMFHGGGGLAGRSNAILAFHANEETPYWSLPMPPTPKSLTINDSAWLAGGGGFVNWSWEFNHRYDNNLVESVFPAVGGQKTPVAVHTYTSAKFIDSEDIWLRFGTQMVHPNDGGPTLALGEGRNASVHGFWWSDAGKPVADRRWALNAKANGIELESGQVGNRNYVKHPWTEDVVGGSSGRIHWFKRAANSWQARIENYNLPASYYPAAIEPHLNVVLCTDGTSSPFLIDLDNVAAGAVGGSWSGLSGTGFVRWAWDDDNECLWALKSDFSLHKVSINKATRVCTVVSVSTGGALPSQYKPEEGYTFEWSRELGGLLFSTSYSRPIWFIRTAEKT